MPEDNAPASRYSGKAATGPPRRRTRGRAARGSRGIRSLQEGIAETGENGETRPPAEPARPSTKTIHFETTETVPVALGEIYRPPYRPEEPETPAAGPSQGTLAERKRPWWQRLVCWLTLGKFFRPAVEITTKPTTPTKPFQAEKTQKSAKGAKSAPSSEKPAKPAPKASKPKGSPQQQPQTTKPTQASPDAWKAVNGTRLHICNLPFSVTEAELYAWFEKYGPPVKAEIIRNKVTQESRGFGFVHFPNTETARKAAKELQGQKLQGRKLALSAAEERQLPKKPAPQKNAPKE